MNHQLRSPGFISRDAGPGLLYQPQQAAPQWPNRQQAAPVWDGYERKIFEIAAENDALLSEVRRNYVLPADSSVVNFLIEHRALPPLLLEAMPNLTACFGPQTVFALRSPIDDSGSRILYAVAMWSGEMLDVRNALEEFDSRWWIHHSLKASGYLTFTYELT